jgi:RNA polymerase sigma factor (sigma-70 family)
VGTSQELLAAALEGDRDAVRALVVQLSPVIQARVARVAMRTPRSRGELRPVIEDLTQEVFAALFQAQGRALRNWAPSRGLSLESYVGLLAEHQAASILRTGRRSAWREDVTEDAALEAHAGLGEDVPARVHAREVLVRLLEGVRQTLSPRGLQLFELLIVEERPVEQVCSALQMSTDAVYAWRSRIGKVLERLLGEIDGAGVSDAAGTRRTLGERR